MGHYAEIMEKQKKLLFIIVVMFWFAQYVYVPYQTPYLLAEQVTFSMTGIIIGVYGFSQLALRMPVGIMADKNGNHKLFIILGMAATILASVCRLSLSSEKGFLLGNILSGIASATWVSFMILYASFFSKLQLQKAMGLIIAANNIGVLIGFILATILYEMYGMRLLCYLSVISGVIGLILSVFLKRTRYSNEKISVKELVTVYHNKRLIFFSLIALIQQGILMSTCMSFTMQMADKYGASSLQIGMMSIIYIIAAVVSSYFAASNIAQRKSPGFWISFTMALVSLYCFAIPHLKVNWMIFFQIFMGMSSGILFSFCTSEALKEIPDRKRSTAMGFFQAVYAVGMTALPIIAGVIAQIYGIEILFYVEGLFAVAGILAMISYGREFI